MKFLDEVKIYISSGNGGPGCVSFRREANLPLGGPDGGNGGNGGDIFIKAVNNLNTLIDFRYKQHFKARTGGHGMGRNRNGPDANDIIIKVPVGTEILDQTKSVQIANLDKCDDEILIAKGGIGGKGNSFFKSSVNQSPRKHQPGKIGEEKIIWLRLKLIADVGLIGLPNSGKSTFLSVVSSSRPKIANYPFTTLYPNLGVAYTDENEFVIADIPGLIKNAHKGSGLGHKFLGHIEKCKILLHLIDMSTNDLTRDFNIIRDELFKYDRKLLEKRIIVIFTKCDLFNNINTKKIKNFLEKNDINQHFFISSVSGKNISNVIKFVSKLLSVNLTKKQNKEFNKRNKWLP